mgnify:CR=1 FL=1
MLFEIAFVILPVFLLVGSGFSVSFIQLLKKNTVDGLAKFLQDFGIPFLLFFNLAILDLNNAFDFRIIICFYSSMIISFIIISCISYFIFKQSYKNSITMGFCAMFSNGVLLGLPISELAYGSDSLFTNYTIIIGHAPLCYLIGITLIEVNKNEKETFLVGLKSSFPAIFFNNLAIGILLGIGFNFFKLEFSPHTFELLKKGTSWIIPISLFTMGGVLYYYKVNTSYQIPFAIILTSLFVQPSIVYFLGVYSWGIEMDTLKNAIIMAAMAPGLNAYFFANMYDNSRNIVATTILISTGLTIFSSSFWIYFLS